VIFIVIINNVSILITHMHLLFIRIYIVSDSTKNW